MLNLPPIIDRIKALLADDTDASVTYAALEARLGLEKVVYERLRQRHDYISHKQLTRWQPGGVINQLISDVDPYVAQTRTLSIAKQPGKGMKPNDEDFVHVGTEVGFDAKSIVKMWNTLGNLALHVKLPANSGDHIPAYGIRAKIRSKVEEVVAELERLSKGTMGYSGFGPTISFECFACGEGIKRRAEQLHDDQQVFCFNPDCDASWRVRKEAEEFYFEDETYRFSCQGCDREIRVPWRACLKMKVDQRAAVVCKECDHANYLECRLWLAPPGNDEGTGQME